MGAVRIVELSGEPEGLSPAVLPDESGAPAVLVAGDHAAAETLAAAGVEAVRLADLGVPAGAPPQAVVEALLEAARDRDVTLFTSQFPFQRPGVVTGLLSAGGAAGVELYPADSPLSVLMLALDVDITAGVDIADARALGSHRSWREGHLVVVGVHNAVLASKVAQSLLREYPDDHMVVLARRTSRGGFELEAVALGDMGNAAVGLRDAAVYVPPSRLEPPGDFRELVRIVSVLRGPDGCPWDREQTPSTLRKNVIEEAYEVVGAIEAEDDDGLAEELGDLLLQIVLQAQMASERGAFDIADVTRGITRKLRRRHPHIFGELEVSGADEVMRNWEAIKREEKAGESVLAGVPKGLPSLALAQKISKKVAGVGFDWETVEDVWEKVHEEIEELKEADGRGDVAEEVGDVLFTVVNVARKYGVDAEIALRDACEKFVRRFDALEEAARAGGVPLEEMPLQDMERLWQDAKRRERDR